MEHAHGQAAADRDPRIDGHIGRACRILDNLLVGHPDIRVGMAQVHALLALAEAVRGHGEAETQARRQAAGDLGQRLADELSPETERRSRS